MSGKWRRWTITLNTTREVEVTARSAGEAVKKAQAKAVTLEELEWDVAMVWDHDLEAEVTEGQPGVDNRSVGV